MKDRVVKDGVQVESREEDSWEEEKEMVAADVFLCVSFFFSQVD